jgi:hypothetical protein
MLDALNAMNKRLKNRLSKVGRKDFDQTYGIQIIITL